MSAHLHLLLLLVAHHLFHCLRLRHFRVFLQPNHLLVLGPLFLQPLSLLRVDHVDRLLGLIPCVLLLLLLL